MSAKCAISPNAVFGKLIARERLSVIGRPAKWRCDCACGRKAFVNEKSLLHGLRTSCFCDRPKRIGQRVPQTLAQFLAQNPLERRAYYINRRARNGACTGAELATIRRDQKNKCAYCHTILNEDAEVDHIVPLARGGSNWPSNLQWLCQGCNLSKGAKDAVDFARAKGLLL